MPRLLPLADVASTSWPRISLRLVLHDTHLGHLASPDRNMVLLPATAVVGHRAPLISEGRHGRQSGCPQCFMLSSLFGEEKQREHGSPATRPLDIDIKVPLHERALKGAECTACIPPGAGRRASSAGRMYLFTVHRQWQMRIRFVDADTQPCC